MGNFKRNCTHTQTLGRCGPMESLLVPEAGKVGRPRRPHQRSHLRWVLVNYNRCTEERIKEISRRRAVEPEPEVRVLHGGRGSNFLSPMSSRVDVERGGSGRPWRVGAHLPLAGLSPAMPPRKTNSAARALKAAVREWGEGASPESWRCHRPGRPLEHRGADGHQLGSRAGHALKSWRRWRRFHKKKKKMTEGSSATTTQFKGREISVAINERVYGIC
jgi:hypothetical protein